MKNFKKICVFCIALVLILAFFQNNAFAYDWNTQITTQAGKSGDTNVTTPVKNIAGAVLTVTRVVAVGVAIVMLIVLAIKYMVSAPGDRATIKKHAVVYIVGAVVMFASSGILGIIQKVANII